MRYSPTAPLADRLRSLRAAVDAGRQRAALPVSRVVRREVVKAARCAHAQDSTAQVRP
jgi:hypothetical protein